jgi:hypothetical protein
MFLWNHCDKPSIVTSPHHVCDDYGDDHADDDPHAMRDAR